VLGVNHFVAKPIDFRQLVDRIEAIAKRFEESESHRLRQG
jgi:DNA-binding response OmpR family regulator